MILAKQSVSSNEQRPYENKGIITLIAIITVMEITTLQVHKSRNNSNVWPVTRFMARKLLECAESVMECSRKIESPHCWSGSRWGGVMAAVASFLKYLPVSFYF